MYTKTFAQKLIRIKKPKHYLVALKQILEYELMKQIMAIKVTFEALQNV